MQLSKDMAELDAIGEAIAGFLMPVIEDIRKDEIDEQEWPAKGPWRKSKNQEK